MPTEPKGIEDAWQLFTDDLALCLSDLDEDDFLIVMSKHKNHYVQFAAQGAFGMRVEAACNTYIEPPDVLSVEDYALMAELGWEAATDSAEQDQSDERSPDGSPNFFIDAERPVDYEALARLAVRSLREVYRVAHPGQLQYSAFGDDKSQIRFPTLKIKRRRE
jgi:hypothetical protein